MIFSCKAINNLYGCGKSTIRKYTLIVCRVLSSRNRLFGTYIHAPRGHILMDTIRKFRDLTGLPNVVGAIDGTYILLSTGPQRGLILMLCDFFNKKNFHSVLLQAMCVVEGFFGNVCVRQPRGVHGAAQFSWLKIYTGLKIQEIFPELFLEIGGLEVGLYLFGDSTYPT